jgi:uncharacterized protein YbbC (DUF1343 family)
MTQTGLDILCNHFPSGLTGKRIGVVCHAASISSNYVHILDAVRALPCTLAAIFGPQHGIFGQTQDNMIEWEGYTHPVYNVPVYSLYGMRRKPDAEMLRNLDTLVIDLQDVGARPYTYIWTIKLSMEACSEQGIPVWILDRPNPIAAVPFDGPMIDEAFYSFVGGAQIPLCHRMTMGEMAILLQKSYFPSCDLTIVWMEHWKRNSLFNETGLPWVLPSPNMPTLDTAIVYPGKVLLEATNLSEGRGTTRPFEIIGAPYVKVYDVLDYVRALDIPGCIFREHGFIPTFQKWQGQYCNGLQVHVTDPRIFLPVYTTVALLSAIIHTSDSAFQFKPPPYEYETNKMPFDILAGSISLRESLKTQTDPRDIRTQWKQDIDKFMPFFNDCAHYPED